MILEKRKNLTQQKEVENTLEGISKHRRSFKKIETKNQLYLERKRDSYIIWET